MQKSITSNEQKTTTTNEEPLMKAMDVAAYLKVSRSWVYQHAASGQLPSRKIGGTRRFVPRESREWALTK